MAKLQEFLALKNFFALPVILSGLLMRPIQHWLSACWDHSLPNINLLDMRVSTSGPAVSPGVDNAVVVQLPFGAVCDTCSESPSGPLQGTWVHSLSQMLRLYALMLCQVLRMRILGTRFCPFIL